MIRIQFTEEEIDHIEYERYNYPDPKVQRKMEALFLKSQGLNHEIICKLCRISSVTLVEYLKQYIEGGLDRLKRNLYKGKINELADYSSTLEKHFNNHPPRTTKEAKQVIEDLTGISRGLTQVREFLKRIGFKYRKVGIIPGKTTDEDKIKEQEKFLNEKIMPRLSEAKSGERDIFLWMPPTLSMKDI